MFNDEERIHNFIQALRRLEHEDSQKIYTEKNIQLLKQLESYFTKLRADSISHVKNKVDTLRKSDPKNPIFFCGELGAGTPLRNELFYTKTLAWFFDNKNNHGFGDTLIISLLNKVASDIGLEHRNLSFNVNSVTPEKIITNNKRIDIFANGFFVDRENYKTPWLLAIEAKVDSDEQKDQLKCYDEYILGLKNKNKGGVVWKIFLTPDEKGASISEWQKMSFGCIARILWGAIKGNLKGYETLPPGLPMLQCYISCILTDIVGMPLPFHNKIGNPYNALQYLEGVMS